MTTSPFDQPHHEQPGTAQAYPTSRTINFKPLKVFVADDTDASPYTARVHTSALDELSLESWADDQAAAEFEPEDSLSDLLPLVLPRRLQGRPAYVPVVVGTLSHPDGSSLRYARQGPALRDAQTAEARALRHAAVIETAWSAFLTSDHPESTWPTFAATWLRDHLPPEPEPTPPAAALFAA